MPPKTWWLLAAAMWPALSATYVINSIELANETGGETTTPVVTSPLLAKRADDNLVKLDFVQRWAAIGDSFTAGIGSGKRAGLPPVGSPDWLCSRYTYTWPQIVDRAIGSGRKDFQYTACSGDRSEGIYKQAQSLQGDLDVVMMTAGGNDLCLVSQLDVPVCKTESVC